MNGRFAGGMREDMVAKTAAYDRAQLSEARGAETTSMNDYAVAPARQGDSALFQLVENYQWLTGLKHRLEALEHRVCGSAPANADKEGDLPSGMPLVQKIAQVGSAQQHRIAECQAIVERIEQFV